MGTDRLDPKEERALLRRWPHLRRVGAGECNAIALTFAEQYQRAAGASPGVPVTPAGTVADQHGGEAAMKVRYTSADGRLNFEMEVPTGKVAFEVVAAIQELFEESECGLCKSRRIRCHVQEYDGNKYYKMVCNDCSATLDYGQRKDGKGLFVRRLDKDTKEPLPARGWYIYQRS